MYQSITQCTSLYQSLPDCARVYQSILRCTKVYQSILRCTKLYQSVLRRTKVYQSVLRCTKVYQSVLECTKVYQGASGTSLCDIFSKYFSLFLFLIISYCFRLFLNFLCLFYEIFLFWKHEIYSRSRSFEHFLVLFLLLPGSYFVTLYFIYW